MSLHYLDFEHSEDTEGLGTFEAMASIAPEHVPAVHAEIALVLAWAHGVFPANRGPLSEGFDWDFDLQSQREYTASDALVFDERARRIVVHANPPGLVRHTVTLSLSGTPAFCEAFRHRFQL
ncbi:MAG: hypothetical protein EOP38_14260 [Rubrivivax sp.]|nr:MAG: hypothetical protein EOP38_14260 [Rubrivivax sp.]